jgi:hypothetical protein
MPELNVGDKVPAGLNARKDRLASLLGSRVTVTK